MKTILCILIEGHKKLYNIDSLFEFYKSNNCQSILFYFNNKNLLNSYSKIVTDVSRKYKILNLSFTSDINLVSKPFDVLFLLDYLDYYRINNNKPFLQYFEKIVCCGTGTVNVKNDYINFDNRIKKIVPSTNTYDKNNVENLNKNLFSYGIMSNINEHVNGKKTSVKWLPIIKRNYSKYIVNEDSINLFIQYFIPDNPLRRKEIDYCLQQNIDNKFIDKIYLLNEEEYNLEILNHPKIIQINIGRRLKYSDILLYTKNNVTGYVIISNSDIFFDESISNLKYGDLSITKSLDALTRYEYDINSGFNNCYITTNSQYCCQDSWILHSNFIKNLDFEDITSRFNFGLGIPSCDQKIIAEFDKLDYKIYNNPEKLKTYHFHTSSERNYTKNDKLDLPYAYIQPYYENNNNNIIFFNMLRFYGLFWKEKTNSEIKFYQKYNSIPNYLVFPWSNLSNTDTYIRTIYPEEEDFIEYCIKIVKGIFGEDIVEYFTFCSSNITDMIKTILNRIGIKKVILDQDFNNKELKNLDFTIIN